MLILYDKDHNKIAGLSNYKEYTVEREINVEDTLSFQYPVNDDKHDLIQEESYIRTKENEYVVKEVNYEDDDWTEYVCKINIEDLKGKEVEHFETSDQKCNDSINLAIAGTGWTIGSCEVTKQRTVRKNNCTVYDILSEMQNAYNCEMCFDGINKKIYIYNEMGQNKGAYFSEQLNLKKLEVQRNSYDYITRLIPIGKDGLDIKQVNAGKNYIENYQYSNKVITAYWEDNRYTVPAELLEDAIARLEYLSKPYKSYRADVIDLSSSSNEYSILDYDLGDTITLLAKTKDTKEDQRIVKITKYPDEPERNSVELANKIASLDKLNVRFQDTSDTVDTVTNSDGTIDGSKVDGVDWDKIQHVKIAMADIDSLNATIANIGNMNATEGNITDLNAVNANIQNLLAPKANVTDLTASNARIVTLETNTASINKLLAGNIGAENIQAGAIQAGSAVIADSAIGSAQIISLDLSKLNAGTINTNKFVVQSDSGNLQIKENTLKVWDTNGKERISLGLNSSDYNLLVRGSDGSTVLFGTDGVTKAGITAGAVDNSKIDTNANIDASKINIDSMFTALNGNTNTLKASKIKFDDGGQTLEVSFNKLTDIVTGQGRTITDQSSAITHMQGAIQSKVSQTEIDNSINNLQVGARNLIIGSTDSPHNYPEGQTGVKQSDGFWRFTTFAGREILHDKFSSIIVGQQYTESFLFRTDGTFNSLNITFFTDNGHHPVTATIQSLGNGIKRAYATYTTQSGDNHIRCLDINNVDVTGGTYFDIMNPKLETGGKATDWSPAPEDVQAYTDTSISNLQVGGRNFVLNSDFSQGVVPNSYAAPPSWRFWGGSCIYGSQGNAPYYNAKGTLYIAHAVTSSCGIYSSNMGLQAGSQYVVSFSSHKEGSITSVDNHLECYDSNNNSTGILVLNYDYAKSDTSQSFVVTIPANTVNCRLAQTAVSSSTAGGFLTTLAYVKVEKGNKGTDWTPAPEDSQVQVFNLTFTNVVGCSTTTDTITDTATGGWGTSGCSSVEKFTNGQYLEWVISSNNVVVGLSHTDTDSNYTSINYSLHPSADGKLYKFENNSSAVISSSWAVGDILRISIDNNVVTYYQNGNLVYTSSMAPTLPLVFDCALYGSTNSISGIRQGTKISGLVPRISNAESSITQLSNSITLKVNKSDFDSLTRRVSTAESSISVLQNQITSKVDSNGVQSIITQSASQVQFAFNQINSSKVTIDAAGLHVAGGSISGCSLTLGGSGNGNGYQVIKDSNGNNIMTLDNSGISIQTGNFKLQSGTDNVISFSKDVCGNYSFEIGSLVKSNISYIDFHTTGKNNDFDVRIAADSSSGKNHLNFIADQVYYNGVDIVKGNNALRSIGIESGNGFYYLGINTDSSGAWGVNVWPSDISMKDNIQDSPENALEKICKIRHRKFNWKDTNTLQILGYVSQEIQQIEDSWVLKVPQPDGYMRMQPNETTIIPYITKAIQEENTKIEALRLRIEILEDKIKEFKAAL